MQLEKLLPSVDMMPDVDRVDNQLNWGSCQSHAAASALELAFRRAGKPVDFSRMYLYYWFQKMSGTFGTDGGGHPDYTAQILNEHGCALEADWPYDSDHIWYTPKPEVVTKARELIPEGSVKTVGLGAGQKAIKRALNQGSPVIFIVNNNHSFWNKANTKDWRKTEWDENDTFTVQHVVLCVGYDDEAGRYLCLNSSGPDWGDGGFFGVPYAYTKYLAGALSFAKLPVPLVPMDGYIPYGPTLFDSATSVLQVPQLMWLQGPFSGPRMHKNVRARIHDGGEISVNGPKFNQKFSCTYVYFQTLSGERQIGFPKLVLDGVEYTNVLCVNPKIELISAEDE